MRLALSLFLLPLLGSMGLAQTTERASLSSAGLEANGPSHEVALSGDGRFVVFTSAASNLVAGDTNGASDVFRRDMRDGTVVAVSVADNSKPGNGTFSGLPSVSADGSLVSFVSDATNLDPLATDGRPHVYVRDLAAGTTRVVDLDPAGMTGDGTLAPEYREISPDGRFVAFESASTNLVAPDLSPGFDVFLADLDAGTVEIVNHDAAGVQSDMGARGGDVSSGGRFVVFYSEDPDLVPGDANQDFDVFVLDRLAGKPSLVSVSRKGDQGNAASVDPRLSADGNFVAYTSFADNLVLGDVNGREDIFVFDLFGGGVRLASRNNAGIQGNLVHRMPDISYDGRFVAFLSTSGNLDPADPDIGVDYFVRDLVAATTAQVSVSTAGVGSSFQLLTAGVRGPAMSGDGRFIAFPHEANNLVLGDFNGVSDIFVRMPARGSPVLVLRDPLRPGETAQLQLSGGRDDDVSQFAYSLTGLGAGPCVPELGGLCLDLLPPVRLAGVSGHDSWGTAVLEITVPAAAPLDMDVFLQAGIPRGAGGAESLLSNALGTVIRL